MHALVAEAMKKAAIIWVSTAVDQPAYPLWCASIGDALYVVASADDAEAGPGGASATPGTGAPAVIGAEQPAPGLAGAPVATVTARGDHGGRIVTWRVHVQPVAPGSDDWSAVAPALAAKRLNVAGSTDDLVTAWLDSATILRLTPADGNIVAAPDDSGAAPARATPAATRTAKPFRLHRVKRRQP